MKNKIKIDEGKRRIRIRIWIISDEGITLNYTDIELMDYELELIREE
jgi:hypothetical protein